MRRWVRAMNVLARRGLLVVLLALIASGGAPPRTVRPIVQARAVASYAAAGGDFGFRLLDQLLATGGENVLVSPLSATLALSMANEGAGGDTRAAIQGTLGIDAPTRDAAAALLASLADPGQGVQLDVANSAWSNRGFALRTAYVDALRTAYRAQATALDFASPRAPDRINAWVRDQTHGKIGSIVGRIPSDVVLYLVNALYFHAGWATPFDRARTRPQPFTTAGGQRVRVPMMSRSGRFAYAERDGVQAVSLPFAGDRFRLVVALPVDARPAEGFRALATAGWWGQLAADLAERQGELSLPRFSLDWAAEMKPDLARLGMDVAFGPGADLRGISDACGCHISSVRQKTHLDVDERGATAAAATSVAVAVSAVRPVGFTMVVDRPFLVALTDGVTGALLLLGVVGNPAQPGA